MITNQSKGVVWRAKLEAFDRSVLTTSIGEFNIGLTTGFLPSALTGHAAHVQPRSGRGCPGQYWDSEKQSWYNYFRDYDATLGRYLQSDPIGLAGGLNTYGYVGGNPLIHIDPLGLAQVCSRPLDGFSKQQGALRHDQFFYKDGTNSGFFSKNGTLRGPGEIREDDPKHEKSYTCQSRNLDDNLLKKAEQQAQTFFKVNEYNIANNNCQHYVGTVIRLYNALEFYERNPGR